MTSITANELKAKGISAIEALLEHQPEAVISVRGKDRFVVMDIEHYHYLRECELDAALAETRADLSTGRFSSFPSSSLGMRQWLMCEARSAGLANTSAQPSSIFAMPFRKAFPTKSGRE